MALFLSDAASHLIGFFATVYIARTLATEGFGQISYGLAFLTYALLLANPGLTTIGAREVAKNPHNLRIIEEILGLRLVLALIISLLFVIEFFVIPGPNVTRAIILLYALSLLPFALFLEFVFQGREEMQYIGGARLCQYGVYIILLFILLKKSQDILMVPIAFFVGYVAAAGFFFWAFLKKYHSFRFRFALDSWRDLLVVAVPVGLATIFNQFYLSLPPIILGIFHSKTDVGLFSAGFKIVVALLIIDRVFYYLFFPMLTKQFAQTPEKLKNSFSFIVRLLFAITIPFTCGGIMLAERMVKFIYGMGYEGSIITFQILLLYFIVAPLNTIFGYGLVAINQERRFFRVIALTTLISLGLIVVLGLIFKGPGAAIALFISELFSVMLMNHGLKKFVKFRSLKFIAKPLLASLMMMGAIYLVRHLPIVLLLIWGGILYLTIFYLFKGYTKEDLRNIKLRFIQK